MSRQQIGPDMRWGLETALLQTLANELILNIYIRRPQR